MSKLTIYSNDVSGVTVVPNIFIDKYMLSANGAYVKVYLYLLRCLSENNPNLSITYLADTLDVVEKDIIRALSYWEKLGLVSLDKNQNEEIMSIRLFNPTHEGTRYSQDAIVSTYSDSVQPEIAVSVENDDVNISPIPSEPIQKRRSTYSHEKISQLTNNDDVKWTMHIIEIYLDRPLKTMEIQLILYLYDDLKFNSELIMYLFEYCVSKNKASTSYIESVALAWAKEGIDTEEKAKEATARFQVNTSIVIKAFGLTRAPGQIEQEYITKWYHVYKMNDDLIAEACNRTILRTQKPDFKYADKILETWFKKNVQTLEQVAALDLAFSKGGSTNMTRQTAMKHSPVTQTNKFNTFPQRNYSEADYASIEQKLLNKSYLSK